MLRQKVNGASLLPEDERLSDVEDWNSQLRQIQGCSWLAAPWLFTECYLYK
jgi:hypothetical protein